MPTLYEILGVKPTATSAEIKKAYRIQAQKVHPDVIGGSKEKFIKVHEAYKTLSDVYKRQVYDMTINFVQEQVKQSETRRESLKIGIPLYLAIPIWLIGFLTALLQVFQEHNYSWIINLILLSVIAFGYIKVEIIRKKR